MRHRAITLDEAQVALDQLAQGNKPKSRRDRVLPPPPAPKKPRRSAAYVLLTAVLAATASFGAVLLNNAAQQHAAFLDEVGGSVLGTVDKSQIRTEALQTSLIPLPGQSDLSAGSIVSNALSTVVPPSAATQAQPPATSTFGDPAAQDREAVRLLSGPNPDYAGAATLLRSAAEAGYPSAQYNLGVLFDNGLGLKQDAEAAARWFRAAAEQDFAQAQYNLALAYATGRGVAQSFEESAAWFQRAADKGIPSAAHNLAALFENGAGIARSLPEAYSWYWVANKLGEGEALPKLRAIGARLGQRQREQAERTAESIMSRILKDAVLKKAAEKQ
jgi:TPR repeat protein